MTMKDCPPDYPIPDRMELGKTPKAVCEAFEVYLDGVRQLLCCEADVNAGYVKRYKVGIGRRPVMTRYGYQTETRHGTVEIRRKKA